LKELSLHILDIAENSVNAGADKIEISVTENIKNDSLSITIIDNGRGMDNETVQRITDPFITSRTTRKVGLGIPFLKAAAEACQGKLTIESQVGKGTQVQVIFQRSHIDRMPLGDLQGTFLSLMIGYPQVNWIFKYQIDEKIFELDDRPIKETLDSIPLSEPSVINYLKENIAEGFKKLAVPNH
jgi:anti-sigma regulatory factor (Ser/Thr protein kinase)